MIQKIDNQGHLLPVQCLSADDFCAYWVPLLWEEYEENMTESQFRSASMELLSEFTGKTRNTVHKWLGGKKNTPTQVGQTLYLLDVLLKIKLLV